MIVLCDTNILLRHSNPADALYQINEDALEYLRRKQCELVFVPQAIYEFWVVATRPIESNGLGHSVAQATEAIEWFLNQFVLFAETSEIFPYWKEVVTQTPVMGKRGHDARFVAAMKAHDVSHLLTFNTDDFKEFVDIVVLDPHFVKQLI